jgi:hypothetical protein
MPRRQPERDLYRQVKDSNFDFMPRGVFNMDEIYHHVKENYPNLCDDEYLCSTHCSNGLSQAEWKHVIRQVLSNIKTLDIHVRKSENRSYWEFL